MNRRSRHSIGRDPCGGAAPRLIEVHGRVPADRAVWPRPGSAGLERTVEGGSLRRFRSCVGAWPGETTGRFRLLSMRKTTRRAGAPSASSRQVLEGLVSSRYELAPAMAAYGVDVDRIRDAGCGPGQSRRHPHDGLELGIRGHDVHAPASGQQIAPFRRNDVEKHPERVERQRAVALRERQRWLV